MAQPLRNVLLFAMQVRSSAQWELRFRFFISRAPRRQYGCPWPTMPMASNNEAGYSGQGLLGNLHVVTNQPTYRRPNRYDTRAPSDNGEATRLIRAGCKRGGAEAPPGALPRRTSCSLVVQKHDANNVAVRKIDGEPQHLQATLGTICTRAPPAANHSHRAARLRRPHSHSRDYPGTLRASSRVG